MARVTVRLPDHLHRSLRSESARTGESLNKLIVNAVSNALEPDASAEPPKTPLQKEVERIRRLLGPMVAQESDFSRFPEHLRPTPDLPNTETLTDALGKDIPPLSAAIIQEREEDTR